ncbi:MAG: hypothetical protein ACOYXN_04750 [Acidobacteriota bacterium]
MLPSISLREPLRLILVMFLIGFGLAVQAQPLPMSLKDLKDRWQSSPTPQEIYRLFGIPQALLLPENSGNAGWVIGPDQMILKFQGSIIVEDLSRAVVYWVLLDEKGQRVQCTTVTLAADRENGLDLGILEREYGRPKQKLIVKQPGSADEDESPPCLDEAGDVEIWSYSDGIRIWATRASKKAWVIEFYRNPAEMPQYDCCSDSIGKHSLLKNRRP